tara:strand:- start:59 stop:550 length:492 start_codon:yes stop_codon:yes gene_type:complete
MSYIEKLKKFIIERSLIQSKSDIDFLFVSYEYDEKKPLDELINDVIEWAYNNDDLEDFYGEHWDVLEESESMIFLQGCDMKDNIALTSFELFRHNSKNKYYYKIKSSGEFADLIDTDDYFDVIDHQNDDSIIVYFKDICNDSFDLDGELDDENLISSSIKFYD